MLVVLRMLADRRQYIIIDAICFVPWTGDESRSPKLSSGVSPSIQVGVTCIQPSQPYDGDKV